MQVQKQEIIAIGKAVNYLSMVDISYNDWINAGFALSNLGEMGRELFLAMSKNPYLHERPKEVNDVFNQIQKECVECQPLKVVEIARSYRSGN